MRRIEVARIVFIDGIHRVLFENRRDLENDGFNWDYLFFGGKLEEGESSEQAVVREVMEELGYDLKEGNFRYFGTYESQLTQEVHTTDHIYVTRLPTRTRLNSREGHGMILTPIHSVRKSRIPPIYQKILDDLESSLRDPDFLP